MKPYITVVIPTLNEEKYIEKCLLGLENQTLDRKDYEVIVVDSNSSDETLSIAKKYADRCLVEKKRVLGRVRNAGYCKAKGEIIANTDADTVVPENWLEQISNSIKGDVVGVYGPALLYDGGIFPNLLSKIFYRHFLSFSHYMGRPIFTGFNSAVKKSAVEQIGYFNKGLSSCEDIDLAYRLAKIGKIAFNNKMVVHTSMRRIKKQGYWGFVKYNMDNYFKYYSTGKSREYELSH